MSFDRKLRVACLGAGYFSQFHLRSWMRLTDVDLVGVCDADLEKAEATGLPAFGSLEDMLVSTHPEVLDLIIPPAGHATTIKTALNAGVPTIICQKPFCVSLEEAEEITAVAEKAGALLVVHENFRFQPWYRAIKAAIAAGRIGDVLQATIRLRPGDGQGEHAYLDRQPYFQSMEKFLVHETGVHWIDTFRFLFGNPTAVYADLRRINPVIAGEDAGFVLFDHPSGIRAMLDGNRCVDHPADNPRTTMCEGLFEGTKGVLSLFGNGSVTLRHTGHLKAREILPPSETETFGGDCVHALQAHVVEHLQRRTPLENSAREYLDVIRIEDAVYASNASARKTIIKTEPV